MDILFIHLRNKETPTKIFIKYLKLFNMLGNKQQCYISTLTPTGGHNFAFGYHINIKFSILIFKHFR
jgi:hypothetical protein